MNFRTICIVFLQVFFSFSAISQIDSTLKDSIKEITIYEYDTVYLQPDTIRLTDTVINIIDIDPEKKEKNVSSFSTIIPNSIGIIICPFLAGNLKEKKLSDSLSAQPIINGCMSVQMNYISNKYLFSIGAGFTPYREKHYFQRTYYSSSFGTNASESYDSLLITKEYSSNYYYNYLSFYISFGRKWELNKKIFLSINAGCIADFLLGYKQGNTNNTESTSRKIDISLGISPNITYKINQRIEIYISPFYQHSLLEDNKFPYTSFQKMGVGLGCNINFKKN